MPGNIGDDHHPHRASPTTAETLAQVQALTRQVIALARLHLDAIYSTYGT